MGWVRVKWNQGRQRDKGVGGEGGLTAGGLLELGWASVFF